MAYKIAVANSKGGIGKTTTAISLATGLIKEGYRVLIIDTDPQRNTTGVYGAQTEEAATLADMLYSNFHAADCIQNTQMGDIIASDRELQNADTQIPVDADRFYKLFDSCEELESKYDYIIMDCPPGNGVILGNVLCYAEYVIIPVTCDKFGLQGLTEFEEVMSSYKKRINPNLKILGILVTMYNHQLTITGDLERELIPSLAEKMSTQIFKSHIRRSVKMVESQAMGISVYDYAPDSTVAEDYMNFTKEIIENIESKKRERK